jgi:nucleoside-diphosphate-sugar epimerase
MNRLRCAVTGANGYVGKIVCRSLQQSGCEAIQLHRRAGNGPYDRHFSLGEKIDASVVRGIDVLVHCAWDVKATSWAEIQAVNVAGSLRLFEEARAAGVARMIFISSMSAFPGCRSFYGRAKLEVETNVTPWGVDIVRPGLVYGDHSGGMMGSLHKLAALPILPVVCKGRGLLYLVHEEDLGHLITQLSIGSIPHQTSPIIAAHPHGRTLDEILRLLARAKGRRIVLVPVPWRLVWAALKSAESLGLRLRLRSDGLVSLMNADAAPDFEAGGQIQLPFRDYSPQ